MIPEPPTNAPSAQPTAAGLTDMGSLSPGDLVGNHIVTRRLGQGGMGVVYEAVDPLLQRSVAVKVLRRRATGDEGAVDLFLAEARSAARLHHPNVVTIHEIDRHDGGYVLVMELVPGGSAQDRLTASGPIPWIEATRLAADACRGLLTAHAAGIIHLDLKPANLLLAPAGVAKLADFGLARLAATTGDTGGVRVCGTPGFMSPEQCRGEMVDVRTDIYSLGATYFTLLTGSPPYPCETDVEIMLAHCSSPVPDPRRRRADVPESCVQVVRRAMAKNPSERYPTARALLVDLESLVTVSPKPATNISAVPATTLRRIPRWFMVLLFAVVVGGIVRIVGDDRSPIGAWLNRQTTSHPAEPHPAEPSIIAREFLLPGPIDSGGAVEAVAFSRDDHVMAWATSDKDAVCILYLQSGRRFAAALPYQTRCLALAPDGRTVVVGTSESRLRFWETTPGLPERAGLETTGGCAKAVAFSPGGNLLAAGIEPWKDSDITLRVWRLGTGEESLSLTRHKQAVDAVAFSFDGKMLASASRDGVIHLWDTGTWKVLRTLRTESGSAGALAFSPGGDTLAAAVVGAADVPTWNTATGDRSFSLRGHTGPVASVAFAPSGRVIATGADDGVRLWDPATGKQRDGPLQGHRGKLLRGLAFSNDGTVLVSGASDRSLTVWHVERPP